MNTRTVAFFKFQELRVYQKSLDFLNWVVLKTDSLPQGNACRLGEMLCSHAADIPLILAEGSPMPKAEFVVQLRHAKASVRKTMVLCEVLCKLGLWNEREYNHAHTVLAELTKMLSALGTSLLKPDSEETEASERPMDENL